MLKGSRLHHWAFETLPARVLAVGFYAYAGDMQVSEGLLVASRSSSRSKFTAGVGRGGYISFINRRDRYKMQAELKASLHPQHQHSPSADPSPP
jgi:hypothetical protein